MRMADGDQTIVTSEKLVGYCLSLDHPRGEHKARMFARGLGSTAENADDLREALLEAAASDKAEVALSDRFGDRYVIDFSAKGP